MAKPVVYKIAAHTTKMPSAPAIARDGQKFTFTWKIMDANHGGGQEVQWRVNETGKWITVSGIGKKTTVTSINLDFEQYYPATGTKLSNLQFRIRGVRSPFSKRVEMKKKIVETAYVPVLSDWAYGKYTFSVPSDPSLSVSAQTEENVNRSTFTAMEANPADTGNVSRSVHWESMLIANCNVTDGSKLTWASTNAGWLSGNFAAGGGSRAIDEGSVIATGSHTRWFRVQARGVKGDSKKYNYKYHVYAAPNAAKINTCKVSTESGTYNVTVNWTADAKVAYPIDYVRVEYIIGIPQAGLVPPSGQWTSAVQLKDTQKTDATTFDVPDTCGTDEALFVRVNTHHDNRVTYGDAVRAAVGKLATPSGLTASINDSSHTATITCQHESEVPDSFIAINYRTQKENFTIAILPHNVTTITGVKIPSTTAGQNVTFEAREVVGTYRSETPAGRITSYSITERMRSASISYGTSVPAAPGNVTAQTTDTPGNVRVTWSKTWAAANVTELSWADHEDAWESTDEPNTYTITQANATGWFISGLETGTTWYIRVRLGLKDDEDITWSQYSETIPIPLSSAPVVPVLELSSGIMTARGSVDASWVYVTSDGTGQGSAKLAEVVTSGGTTTYNVIATTRTEQHFTISAARQGWTTGTTHLLAVRVTSGSGKVCDDWSAPVPVMVANAVTAAITQTSLETITETISGDTVTYTGLTAMPLTLTVMGAKAGGTTSVVIERASEYRLGRPDESVDHGYDGETIVSYSQTGEAQITIDENLLIGSLDDGADYVIIATTQDSYGQTATAEQKFRVKWAEHAIMPEATVLMDEENMISRITPIAPTGATITARCDIYRLSADKPQLIYKDAVFGTEYVDPFPTIGEFGGHRLVYHTTTGNEITEDNTFAWLDLDESDGDTLDLDYNIIDFGAARVELAHNIDISNSWAKDFTETKYLGGSVRGDWNAAVSRSGSMSAVAVATEDHDLIQAMRRLAVHAGICHVRTKEGSSYAADVQVSEKYQQSSAHKVVTFDLKITRVDSEDLDGMTYAEWEAMHPQEG